MGEVWAGGLGSGFRCLPFPSLSLSLTHTHTHTHSLTHSLPSRPSQPLPQVVFYDQAGKELQVFDYSSDDGVREFCSCNFNPSGDTVVFGTYNRFYTFTYNTTRMAWEDVSGARGA
jgi:hypothetical protein